MARIKPSHAFATARFQGFDGIRSDALLAQKGASDMRNFRILSDGSLEKRCGYRAWQSNPAAIRGFWYGTLQGTSKSFSVCGNHIYAVSGPGDPLDIGITESSTGRVSFSLYGNDLYMADGTSIYSYDRSSQSPEFGNAVAYVPLVGKNWRPSGGDPYEEENLLTSQMRVSYKNPNHETLFSLPYAAASIQSVTCGGTPISVFFSWGRHNFSISSADAATGNDLLVTFTKLTPDLRSAEAKASSGLFRFKSPKRELLFLFGAQNSPNVFYTSPVTDGMLEGYTAFGLVPRTLYVKASNYLTIGDSNHPVRSAGRNYDRVILANDNSVWSVVVSEESEAVSAYPVLVGIGSVKKDGIVPIDRDNLLFTVTGILRLHSSSTDPDNITFVNFSSDFPDWNGGALSHCEVGFHQVRNELWIRDTEDNSGLVRIKNLDNGQWYCFDGISADFFLTTESGFGFADGNRIYLFDETVNTDKGEEFSAYYQSDYLSFGHPEERKRNLRATLTAHTNGASVQMLLEGGHTADTLCLRGKVTEVPEEFDIRGEIFRYRDFRFRITSSGTARSRFYAVLFVANL